MTLYEFLKTHNKIENYKQGIDFGNSLYKLHESKANADIDWYEIFNTRANYLFYMHGVSDEIGDDDYILIDYINSNKHLSKNIETHPLLGKTSIKDISIDEDIQFNVKKNKFGDRVYDFINLNQAALISPDFSNGVMESYFKGAKIPVKFFRLLSLYQAYIILDNLVARRNNKDTYISYEEIKGLLAIYDNFNQYIPSWIKEA